MASNAEKKDLSRAKAAANYMTKREYKALGRKSPGLPKATVDKLVKAKPSIKEGTKSPKSAMNAAGKINRANMGQKITNQIVKESAKRGANVGGSGSVSARQPSMPVKTGIKGKIKAQGAKTMSQGLQYGKTKPKGK